MNKTYQVFVRLMAHPLSICSMALLIANDLVFQPMSPSWLTGKLSDFAWFMFAPYLLALLLAVMLPSGLRREKIVGGLAFGLALAGFAALKTIPAVHQELLNMAGSLGIGLKLAFDPTDVAAALAGCSISLFMWLKPRLAGPLNHRKALFAMAAGTVLIAADMAAPNPGINCLSTGEGFIKAADWMSVYVSSDGGLTWQESQLIRDNTCQQYENDGQPRMVSGSDDLRYTPGWTVERTSDGGQTWQVVYNFEPLREVDRQYYLIRASSTNDYFGPTPLDALKDPVTGNVIFAMGHEGLLIYTAGGEWSWAGAGPYVYARSLSLERIFSLLTFDLLLAIYLAGLAFGIFSLRWRSVWWKWLLLIPASLAGILLAISPPAAFQTGYALGGIILGGGAVLIGLLLLFTLFEAVRRHPRVVVRTLLWSLLVGAVYLLGPLLWSLGILPRFNLAGLVGLVLSVSILIWKITRKNTLTEIPASGP